MGKVTPFFAADQPLVDDLCELIRIQHYHLGEVHDYFTSRTQELYERIVEDED